MASPGPSSLHQHGSGKIFPGDGLTEDLIDAIEDPAKLRSLLANFYRKVQTTEKEFLEFRTVQGKKLQEAQSENEVFKQEMYRNIQEALEQDFNCSICSELFIQPSVLDCGHTYCNYCIVQWNNGGNRDCPICRKTSFRPVAKYTGLQNYINKIHTMLSPEIRDYRNQIIREREQLSNNNVSVATGTGPASSVPAPPDPNNTIRVPEPPNALVIPIHEAWRSSLFSRMNMLYGLTEARLAVPSASTGIQASARPPVTIPVDANSASVRRQPPVAIPIAARSTTAPVQVPVVSIQVVANPLSAHAQPRAAIPVASNSVSTHATLGGDRDPPTTGAELQHRILPEARLQALIAASSTRAQEVIRRSISTNSRFEEMYGVWPTSDPRSRRSVRSYFSTAVADGSGSRTDHDYNLPTRDDRSQGDVVTSRDYRSRNVARRGGGRPRGYSAREETDAGPIRETARSHNVARRGSGRPRDHSTREDDDSGSSRDPGSRSRNVARRGRSRGHFVGADDVAGPCRNPGSHNVARRGGGRPLGHPVRMRIQRSRSQERRWVSSLYDYGHGSNATSPRAGNSSRRSPGHESMEIEDDEA